MPSTTALLTALTGMNASARSIDVIGNNIANINTTAFKSTRLMFSNMFSRTVAGGTPPSDTSGGTNPHQIGYGAKIAGTQRNFTNGAITSTGDSRDLAIEGNGFFVVNRQGQPLYTRDGAFRQNSANDLVTLTGDKLQGFGVDADFNIVPGTIGDLNIPLGGIPLASATRNVTIAGNLKADGELPTAGSVIGLGSSASAGFRTIAGANPPVGAGNLLETTTRLVDLEDPSLVGSGTSLFSDGQRIELRAAEKGNKTIRTSSLDVTSATTVQDLAAFLSSALGIDVSVGPNPDGSVPGVTLDPLTGRLTVVGNTGTANDLDIDGSDLRLLDSTGALVRMPFVPDKTGDATGESVRTTFVVFDSLGGMMDVDATLVLDARDSFSTTWRYFIESPSSSDATTQAATGTLVFDTDGRLQTATPVSVAIQREDEGVTTAMTFDLSFLDSQTQLTSLADDRSQVSATFRDGAPIGSLAAFSVGQDGTITGSFTNGLTRTLGQVALASFSNNEGLVDLGSNLFQSGANSGPAAIVTPGSLGAGRIVGGTLEASNVDMGEEFIKLIQASTGYSANSRIIRTTDELMQQLLVLGR